MTRGTGAGDAPVMKRLSARKPLPLPAAVLAALITRLRAARDIPVVRRARDRSVAALR